MLAMLIECGMEEGWRSINIVRTNSSMDHKEHTQRLKDYFIHTHIPCSLSEVTGKLSDLRMLL